MKNAIPLIFIILDSVMGCKSSPDTSCREFKKAAKDWFEEGSWFRGISARPDASVDTLTLYQHYSKHSGIWEQVFDFLRNTNLETIDTGKYTLETIDLSEEMPGITDSLELKLYQWLESVDPIKHIQNTKKMNN